MMAESRPILNSPIFRMLLVLNILIVGATATAQTWTYQGTEICYTLGSTVQCYSRGTIRNFVGDRQSAFSNSAQARAGIGSLAGVLVAAWLRHRQQVKIETEQLAKQLQAYFDAESDLVDDEQKMESEDQQFILKLEELDPTHKAAWVAQLESSKKLHETREKYLADLKGLLVIEMKEKRKKAMQYFIGHEPDGARARYDRQRTMAAQCFVVNQFLGALSESYRQHPPTPEEQGLTRVDD
jgi:hypothetical protein